MNPVLLPAIGRLWAVLGDSERRSLRRLLLVAAATALAELALLVTVVPFALTLTTPSDRPVRILGTPVTVVQAGLLFLATIGIATLLRLALLTIQAQATRRIAEALCLRSYARTLERPYIEHVGASTSQITATLTSRLDIILQSVVMAGTAAIGQAVMMASIVAALFVASASVTLIVLVCVVGAYAVFLRRGRAVVATQSQRHNRATSRVTRILAESLNGIRDVLLAGSERYWIADYREAQHDLRDANAQLSVVAATPRIVVEAVGFAVIVAVACLLVATMPSASGPVSILAVVILGSQRLLPVAQGLYASWNNLNAGLPHLLEVLPLLEQPDRSRPPASAALPLAERLELRGIGYAYPGAAGSTIRDATLAIPAGAVVGIVGRTGSGKSTLLDLVMGLLPPDEGALVVDGRPLAPNDLPRWQRGVAHVAQSVYLADATVAQNIALGDPAATIDQTAMREAAALAQIADFVEGLPLGYDTPVGERGVRLSGGQRQRIGIARALYRRSELLILDEATSSLDVETERAVMAGIATRMGTGQGAATGSGTVMIVTHRIGTLARCDAIYRLADGTIEGPIGYAELAERSADQAMDGSEAPDQTTA